MWFITENKGNVNFQLTRYRPVTLKISCMQMSYSAVTLCGVTSLPFVPGYTHTHVRAHKHALCRDVPGCSLTLPFLYPSTFSPSIPPFFAVLIRELFVPVRQRGDRPSLSLSLSVSPAFSSPFDLCQSKGTASHFLSECCVAFQDTLVIFCQTLSQKWAVLCRVQMYLRL